VEKSNPANRLAGNQRRPERADMLNARSETASSSFRFETRREAFGDSHAIPAPFAAQIIGQVLAPKRTDPARGLQAYSQTDANATAPRLVRWA